MASTKKVIWIINQYAGSPYHGMTFRTYYLAKNFIKKHEVNVFSASFSHVMSTPPNVNRNTTESIDGIIYHWIKVFKYSQSKSVSRVISMFLFLFKLFFFSTDKLNKPDVIIVSSISPLPIWRAYLWSKKFKAKLIFEVRDLWPLSLVELGGISVYNPFVLFLGLTERFAYKVSDYVVSVLPDAFMHMQKKGLCPKRFKCIPNGIDLNMIQSKILPEFESKIPNNKFIVAYTGAIGIANSLITFAKAAKILNDNSQIQFLIVGDGSEKESILSIKQKYSLSNLLILDPISKSSVIPFLSKYVDACYIGLQSQPIFRFGISPNKLFDYLYSSTPIIQSIDASNDIVKDAKAGFSVEPENPKAIAEAIIKLSNLTLEERKELGRNGREYVEKYHSYEKLAQQYESLF
jgi:glycosyltransferase involved in cell wall biosynthesis